jgi:hypothetical protein
MTAIGKIFVIINLLFSCVVAGFIVMVYAKSANWKSATDKWQASYAAADASRQAVEKDLKDEQTKSAAKVAELEATIKQKDDEIKNAKAEVTTTSGASEKIKKDVNGEQASMLSLQTQLEKRKKEVVELEQQIKDKDEAIVKNIKGKNDAVEAKVAAEIKATSFQAKAERLEARVRETEMEIVKLRRTGGAGGTTPGTSMVSTGSTSNPPSQAVEGIVTEKSGDLIRISIGSDAGLEKGHTLDVFRLKPTPQYLGQIRLTDVRSGEAVGVPVDRLKYPVQKGDFVSNDVTAKK